ncbi:MAG: response regulator transcription factor [Chloroflexi bacterium]|nr:response regulator transcription factor [Chloroflexota bacterium]
MKVLLADDHELVRKGLASLLASRNIEVVSEASNGQEVIEKARKLKPTVILMDLKMPVCDGLQATRQIKAEMPDVKIVMLTVCEDDRELFEAVRAGADGYILKNLKADEFFRLLSGLERGEAAFAPSLATRVIVGFSRRPSGNEDELTQRELEVLKLVAGGESNKEIANRLQVSENTVKFHLRNVMEKLHLKNRTQLATYALNKGIVPPSADHGLPYA